MDNKQLYKATLCFSLHRVLWDFLGLLGWAALAAVGFLIAEKTTNKGLVGLLIGAVIGLILLIIFLRWVSYTFKAGQIAMMTKGVTENTLPDDVLGEGKKIVKSRFLTVAAFFAATRIIKGIFNQISRGLESLGGSIGGNTGSSVGSAISSAIQVLVSYLCDCCLGWVFYRKEIKSGKATLEGAALFFKHGKTLAKNIGRIFGMGLASLALIGGVFFGIFYLIASRFPVVFERLFREISESAAQNGSTLPDWLSSPGALIIAAAALGGFIVWMMIHSAFIRPFILVGVLRNYIQSGINDMPTEESLAALDSKSARFRKLHEEESKSAA